MSAPVLRNNLLRLNDLLTLADRRELLAEIGMGAAEIVAYLVGDRSPHNTRIRELTGFFGIECNLRHEALDDLTLQRARFTLARRRRQRNDADTPTKAARRGGGA